MNDCPGDPHWHLVGGSWRPLHEQLNALTDATTWVRASAPQSPSASAITGPVVLAESFKVASVQCGHEYAVVTVSGALDGSAIRGLRTFLRGLIECGVLSLLIDLSQASGDDGRLGLVLERTEASLRVRHGRRVLLNVPVGIRSSLDIGRLPHSMASCPSRGPAARAAPSGPPGAPVHGSARSTPGGDRHGGGGPVTR
ncbi:MAG: hypothetical protein QOJ11_3865 [Frankiales bacterium]|jgi:hypothetical protein|nr:hypothetical protein [Frankiales bacterium]